MNDEVIILNDDGGYGVACIGGAIVNVSTIGHCDVEGPPFAGWYDDASQRDGNRTAPAEVIVCRLRFWK